MIRFAQNKSFANVCYQMNHIIRDFGLLPVRWLCIWPIYSCRREGDWIPGSVIDDFGLESQHLSLAGMMRKLTGPSRWDEI